MISKFRRPTVPACALALALTSGLSPPAVAGADGAGISATATVPVFESTPHFTQQRKTSTFAINPELGRAWVEVTIDTVSHEDRPDFVRVRIPGLSYDATARSIVLQADDRVVECARVEVRGRGPLTRHVIEPTGLCEITKRYVQIPVDDGFEVAQKRHLEVRLTSKP